MQFLQDLKLAQRSLVVDLRFALTAIVTLGLGVGACTTIFSVVYGVLLQPLPYPDSERLVTVWQLNEEGRRGNLSDPNFEDLEQQNRVLEVLSQYNSTTVSVAGGSSPARVMASYVSEGFFDAMSVPARAGRVLEEEDHREAAAPAVVVSYGFFRRYLDQTRPLPEHPLRFSGSIHDVVGVMPPGFDFPPSTDIWVAREQVPRYPSRTAHNWKAVGRLLEGATLALAQEDISGIAKALKRQHGEDTWMEDASVLELRDLQVGPVRSALWILMGAVGFLLVVACTNVANLLLARVTSRRRELAVRAALGASRPRLLWQFVAEALLLALFGGALGALLAAGGVRLLLSLEPGNLPRLQEVGVNGQVLLFAFGLSLIAAVGLSLTAVYRATAGQLQGSLGADRSNSGNAQSVRLRGALVVGQLAITLVLLLGAGLLGRSLWNLLVTDPGFVAENRLVMDLTSPFPQSDEDRIRLSRFHQDLLEGVRRIPGVERAGAVDRLPIATGHRNGVFLVMKPGEELPTPEQFGALMKDPERTGTAEYRAAAPGYFQTLGIPLIRGRLFNQRDSPQSQHVALISQSLAETQWPREDPLGKLIEFGNMDGDLRLLTVVGVVGDVRHRALDQPPKPTLYTHAHQRPPSTFSVVMSLGTAGADAAPTIRTVRALVAGLDSELPPRFRTIDEVFSISVADRRFQLILLSVFGACALVLAAVGIYGVTSYSVSQRTREIGVRMALGAARRDIVTMVLKQGATWVGLGVAIGLIGALALSRLLTSVLYEVRPSDPTVFPAVGILVAVVAIAACYSPARRATSVDPISSLRDD